ASSARKRGDRNTKPAPPQEIQLATWPRHTPHHQLRERVGHRKTKQNHPSHGDTRSPTNREQQQANQTLGSPGKDLYQERQRVVQGELHQNKQPQQPIHTDLQREHNNKHKQYKTVLGEPPPDDQDTVLGEPTRTHQPTNSTLNLEAARKQLETSTEQSWEKPSPRQQQTVLGDLTRT
ncbi:hypothetical protein Taro_038935, partial [Colocasia esculenta]|nr:hypothetical protein [Colocasia esculenta]